MIYLKLELRSLCDEIIINYHKFCTNKSLNLLFLRLSTVESQQARFSNCACSDSFHSSNSGPKPPMLGCPGAQPPNQFSAQSQNSYHGYHNYPDYDLSTDAQSQIHDPAGIFPTYSEEPSSFTGQQPFVPRFKPLNLPKFDPKGNVHSFL